MLSNAKSKLRSGLSGIFILGIFGTFIELLLLDHTEDFWQLLPLILLGIGLISFLISSFSETPIKLKLFRIVMIFFILSGITGVWMHYQTNVEFEKEMYPGLEGLGLFTEAMKGATPSLAPGAMLMLGLIGLLRSSNA